MKQTIKGLVILDNNADYFGEYNYSACQMYTDNSYVLNVYGGASMAIKQLVKQHVEDLHDIVVTTVTRG